MIHNSLFSIRNLHRIFFYLLVLFLPSQLGLHFWPQWSFVLGRRIDYLSPTLFFTDILIFLTVGSWIAVRIYDKLKISVQRLPVILGVALFAAVNIYLAKSPAVSAFHWVKVFEFTLLGMYIVRTKPSVSRIAYALCAAMVYVSVLAIWQFLLQHTVGGAWWLLGERTFSSLSSGIAQIPICLSRAYGCRLFLRSYAMFPHPNVLGAFLSVVIPLVIRTEFRSRFLVILKWTAVTLGVVALVLTFSRSAWIVGVLLIVWQILEGKATTNRRGTKDTKGIRSINTYVGLAVVIALIVPVVLSLHATDESVVVREQLAVAAVNIWKTAPLPGVGLGNFLVALPSFVPTRTIYFLQPVHNIYLLLLSEVGIVGICLIVFLAIMLLNSKLRIMNQKNKEKISLFPILYSLFALLLLGLVDHYLLTIQQTQILLALYLGMSLS